MNNRFLQALNQQRQRTEPKNPLLYGTLGITLNGQTVVEVPDRASFVYVQLRSTSYEVIQAFNQVVSPVYGLPVILQWQGNRYIIVSRDTLRYSNWIDSSAYLPRHASTHEREGSAGDVVFVSQEQFLPLMPMPSGSNGNKQIVVGHYNLMTATGTFQYFATQPTVDLTVWKPTSPTGAVMVLVMMDGNNGNLTYAVGSGSVFGNWLTGSPDVLPFVPPVTDISRYLPIAAVRLITGTTNLSWDNIYDVRPIFGATRSVNIGGGGGGTTAGLASGTAPIWLNNGVFVATGTQINLLGSSFTITSSGTEIELTIAGGGGGGTSGSLLLDTSNGPLFGPLVIYQKLPNTQNQYFDYSTLVGYLSGTSNNNFGAAGEFVVWSTGVNSHGVSIDDRQAGGNSLRIIDQGIMDKITFVLDESIDSNRIAGRYLNPMVQWRRLGNNSTRYVSPLLYIIENDPLHTQGPTIEIDGKFNALTTIFPTHTGTPWSIAFPFPFNQAPYGWDTYNALPTGVVHSYWNHQSKTFEWIADNFRHFFDAIGFMEHTGTATYPLGNSLGMALLNNGTVTVPTKRVTDSSRIFLTTNVPGTGTVGFPYVASRSAGSGFTILSSSLSDNSRVAWMVVEPFITR